MHQDEIKIIESLRGGKKEYSTSEIIRLLYPNEYKTIEEGTNPLFKDKEKINAYKKKKAQLHRKGLYHLNRLVDDKILKVERVVGKGQKYFSLAISDDEEIILEKSNRKRIVISKPHLPAMPIEGYEQKNLIKKFEEGTWINRVNASILQCKSIGNIEKLKDIIRESFSYINDTLGINDFETIIEKSRESELDVFLKAMDEEASDYGKMISIIIDFSNIKLQKSIIPFINLFSEIKPSSINLIFDTNAKELQKNEELMEFIVEKFSKAKIQIHIKNQECHDAPYILGRAGPYTFSEEEWNVYREEYANKISNIICGQSTISIDVGEFFKQSKSASQFREFILNISKSLLYANSMQRSRSSEYFKYLIDLNKPHTQNLLSYSRSYIRFWNYGWKEQTLDPEIVFDLIKSTKEVIAEFCKSEETIYKSCGMPTRFKIGFSCAFKDLTEKNFSEQKFRKLQIKKLEDLYSPEMKKLIFEKEKIFGMFEGGDRLRLYRGGNFDNKEVVREMNIILNTYKIPFFCYDFGEVKGTDLSLNAFIE